MEVRPRWETAQLRLQNQLTQLGQVEMTSHLNIFIPQVRVKETDSRYLKLIENPVHASQLNSFSPEGMDIYGQVFTQNRGEGLWLDSFAKGVSILGGWFDDEYRAKLRELLRATLDCIVLTNAYPAISENHMEAACNVIAAVLANGEMTGRESSLAYCYGIWHVAGAIQGWDSPKHPQLKQLEVDLLRRANLAVME